MIKPNSSYENRMKLASDDPNEVGYNQLGLAYVLYQRLRSHNTNSLLLVTSYSKEKCARVIDMIRRHDQAAFELMY